MKILKPLLITALIMCILFLSGCADAQHNINPCLEGHTYGFWGGLWHGMIVFFSWIGSLFSDDIAVWAVNNNGGWYAFGFMLGAGGLTSLLKAVASSLR